MEFHEWDFSGGSSQNTQEEAERLFGILEDLGKEVYTASYHELGAPACRILVPGYSEVYPVEDLVWDNTNKALDYREDILNLHRLGDDQLAALSEHLEESQIDDYADIITLIGIEFDENTVWGQLTVLELSCSSTWPWAANASSAPRRSCSSTTTPWNATCSTARSARC